MQKTSSGKKTFLPVDRLRPSQNLTKSLQKLQSYQSKTDTELIQGLAPEKTIEKLTRNPSFQYYFYDKYNSTKQLNKLRNSRSVKNLLEKERQKSLRLDE